MTLIRLQKFLSMAGACSRRKGEEHILNGLVRVNGRIVSELGAKVDPEKDMVEFEGEKLLIDSNFIYIALNKPRGYVTSCSDRNEKTIMDFFDIKERIYPVGRLDKDSSGLILLTNDGPLHNRLCHPSFDHEKEYQVMVESPVEINGLKKLAQGIFVLGRKTRPAKVKRISQKRFIIVLKEGRNRQIRRMVENLGNKVVDLRRTRIANIRLGGLAEGKWRYLTEKERKVLLESLAN